MLLTLIINYKLVRATPNTIILNPIKTFIFIHDIIFSYYCQGKPFNAISITLSS